LIDENTVDQGWTN